MNLHDELRMNAGRLKRTACGVGALIFLWLVNEQHDGAYAAGLIFGAIIGGVWMFSAQRGWGDFVATVGGYQIRAVVSPLGNAGFKIEDVKDGDFYTFAAAERWARERPKAGA